MIVGRIAPSGSVFTPDAEVIASDFANSNLRNLASDRMREYLRAEVTAHLGPLKALRDFKDQEGALAEAKGFAYTLLENNGSVERRDHLKTIQNLNQDARRQLRELGVQFGFYNVYMPEMLKPKPARLLSLLNAYGAGGDKTPFIPFAGVTSIPNEGDLQSDKFSENALALAGYRAVGSRIVRLDILNRLSLMIRQAQDQFGKIPGTDTKGRPFQIMQEMLSLLGGTYEDTQKILVALGYQSEIRESLPDLQTTEETAPEEKTPHTEADAQTTDSPKETATESRSEDEKTAGTPPTKSPKPTPKKSSGRNDLNLYNNRVHAEDGSTTEIANKEVWLTAARGPKGGKPKGAPQHGKTRYQKGSKGKPKPNYRSGRSGGSEHKGKASLKNSPFAALAALNINDSSEKEKKSSEKKSEKKKDDKKS